MLTPPQTFPLMCIFLLAAGLSLLGLDYGPDGKADVPVSERAGKIGPVVL